MEKFYIVENQEYLGQLDKIKQLHKERTEFIKPFIKEKGIDGGEYILSGSGFVGTPFTERNKEDISFYINDTENNRSKFGTQLCKNPIDGMRKFKKSSKVLKELQDKCVQEKVVVIAPRARVGDNFVEFEFGGYSYIQFKHNGALYLNISSDRVDSITPKVDGFIEIKGSEFYAAKEQYEVSKEVI